MSQQINLYNPALRKRRDWLSLQNVVIVSGMMAAVFGTVFGYLRWEVGTLERTRMEIGVEAKSLQQEVLQLGKSIGDRKNDPALARSLEVATLALSRRQEALNVLRRGSDVAAGLADSMRGFARQSMEGVWLTGFSLGQDEIEIRGRMVDAALLPAYIRRLNAEPAFRGRRFAALDIKRGEPERDKAQAEAGSVAGEVAAPKYLEFYLRSSGRSEGRRPEAGG